MSAAKSCLNCGAPLADAAPEGFCDKCLFGQAGAGVLTSEAERDRGGPETEGGAREIVDETREEPTPLAACAPTILDAFGDYELLEEIGRGGMGVVYRARQKSLDRAVAIKMVAFGSDASPELIKRFRAEAVVAAALQHPNVVAVHEVGIHQGRHFFVMDYVAGQSLAQLVRNQAMPPRRAARYLQTVAEAIHFAHERGILHRDLKPSNILIDSQDQPRVVDFGLARKMDDSPLSTLHSQLTLTGQMLGSPNYLPPEQAAGKTDGISRRTDIYALGATLYHLLTGRPPFQSESLAQTLDLVLHQEPVPPRLLHPSVPRDLETICLKCLEKEPARRYRTAKELAEDLGRFLSKEPIRARPVGHAGKAWRWARRNPLAAGMAGAAILFLCLGFAGVLGMWRHSERQRQRAEKGEYILAMNTVQQLLAINPDRALDLLRQYPPFRASPRRPLTSDLRQAGWEWRYLWQESRAAAQADAVFGRMPSRIRSLEVSPDGRWLLATSEVSGVRLWDLETTDEIQLAPEARDSGVKAFGAFSPDSAVVAFTDQTYASGAGQIGFWDTRTRRRLEPISDPWIVGTMGFSPDGRLFGYAACSIDTHVKVEVLDFKTRQRVNRLDKRTRIGVSGGEESGLLELGLDGFVARDGRTVVCCENYPNPEVLFWDYIEGQTTRFPVREAIVSIALSPDGQTLATASGYTETAIRLWKMPEFHEQASLSGHQAWVACVRFSPDGKLLVSAGSDRMIRLWDLATTHCVRSLGPLSQPVYRVCFTPDGRQLFAGTADGTIYRWPVVPPPTQQQPRLVRAKLTELAAAPDGAAFAGITGQSNGVHRFNGGSVLLGNTDGAEPLKAIPELGTNNTTLLFSPDGHSLVTGTDDGQIQAWSLEGRQLTIVPLATNSPVVALVQDPQARTLIFLQEKSGVETGARCHVGVVSLSDRQARPVVSFPAATSVCALSPDARWLAVGQMEGPVRVWDLRRSPRLRTLPFTGRITGVAFSPDGQWLAACSLEGKVMTWPSPHFDAGNEVQAHAGAVIALSALAFSADSRRLATAGDGVVTIWDVETRQELITLRRPGEIVLQIAFSADGNQLLARNSRGDALFWHAPSWTQVWARQTP